MRSVRLAGRSQPCVIAVNESFTSARIFAGRRFSAGGRNRGELAISGRRSTLRFGVNGSGSRIFRGKALKMRFRICMQLGGTTLQICKVSSSSAHECIWKHTTGELKYQARPGPTSKWYSHKNSGKSCNSTSSTLSVPLYSSRTESVSSALRRYGSRKRNSAMRRRWKGAQPC